jgi:hypothetical protein
MFSESSKKSKRKIGKQEKKALKKKHEKKPQQVVQTSRSKDKQSVISQFQTRGSERPSNGNNLSNLQEKFRKKLESARFRSINEELYTKAGQEAFHDFQQNPEKFTAYHRGYREQASMWPCNPLHNVINWIQNNFQTAVVADMGCGEATLAETLSTASPLNGRKPFIVHSFDLVAANASVVACDISHTPLAANTVDIVIFCLSLMGINFHEFIYEAHRILKLHGIIKIVEVRSRFESNNIQDDFRVYLSQCGFKVRAVNTLIDNKMFFDIECEKIGPCSRVKPQFTLKACQYKKR